MEGTPVETPLDDAITTRPVDRADVDALVALHRRVSVDMLRCRFLTPHPDLSAERIARLTDVDGRDRAALVAEHGGRLVGIARYERHRDDEAVVTLVVDDVEREQDVEVLLLTDLVAIARRAAIRRLVLEVHPLDRQLIETLERSPLKSSWHLHAGVVTITLHVAPRR